MGDGGRPSMDEGTSLTLAMRRATGSADGWAQPWVGLTSMESIHPWAACISYLHRDIAPSKSLQMPEGI